MISTNSDGEGGGAARGAPAPPDGVYWDPFDESLKADPHPRWRRLRDEAPVYYNETYDFWALSRFDDVERAHRDPKVYSSAHGTVLEMMTEEALGQGMMIFLDPPEHTVLRRLVSKAFTPRRVAELEGEIRTLCVRLLDVQRGQASFDYVQDFGAQLPAYVIAALLGVPPSDRDPVRHHIDEMFHIEPGVGMANDVSMAAGIWLAEYMDSQLNERRTSPGDDMFTDLVQAEITDQAGTTRRLTPEESTEFALLIIGAGTETVARLLGWAGLLLADHPDQLADLASDLSLIPNAVEELLRYESPSPVQGRWLTEEVELHGQVIPVDSKVLLLTGSAGRDDRVYPEADRFDVRRTFKLHVAFGYGIHFCLGAALARMEGKVALEETLKRYKTWTVDKERAVPLHTSTVRGYKELPINV
ncbi:MAG TPA: cytochrome P450 [Acidimicrobiales bacterium]|jgi:cytochrome P450|nr:cytochrome P450 [Acidimicrobiales bacterium]